MLINTASIPACLSLQPYAETPTYLSFRIKNKYIFFIKDQDIFFIVKSTLQSQEACT